MRVKTHPGEVLREEFMHPLQLSSSKLSGYLGVPLSRVTEIVNEKRGVTADTAVRLAKFFGNSAEFWINLQAQHDLSKVEKDKGAEIRRIPSCEDVVQAR